MKKRILSLFLALITVLFFACGIDPVETQPVTSGVITDNSGTSADTEPVTDAQSTDVPVLPPEEKPVGDGVMIYCENFDSYSNSADPLKLLGWTKLFVSDGAYNDNTTAYSIVDYNSGKALKLVNNTASGKDSYVEILSGQFGWFQRRNYTLQYDLEYLDASNNERYIAIVTEYSGKRYNSFHFRNRGTANNQFHCDGEWLTFDVAGENFAAGTNEFSIVSKLLGKEYDKSAFAFKNISVSIRYIVDWENGNSVYMRVNDETSFSGGKWVLVSQSDPGANGASFWAPDMGGYGVVLKTGGKQNGYVDNIMLWTGTSEAPTEAAPLISSENQDCYNHVIANADCTQPMRCICCTYTNGEALGHSFEGSDGARVCSRCLRTEESVSSGWLLDEVPVYNGGKLAPALYKSGHGIASTLMYDDTESYMSIISRTNETEFNAYCEKLTAQGYKEIFSNDVDGNLYRMFDLSGKLVYVYFTKAAGEARIILDRSTTCTENKFTSEGSTGKVAVYQVGLPQRTNYATQTAEQLIDCGMMYVARLADNSLIIVDGGSYKQFDASQIDGVMNMLREITNTPEGGKIKIAAWYITHGHSDHMSGFALVVKKYSKEFDLYRMMFNFPSVNSDNTVLCDHTSNYKKLINYIDKYFSDDDVQYIKIHTGQTFEFDGLKLDVLYTHEDCVSSATAITRIDNDFNNTSSVVRFSFDGKKMLVLGDINQPAMRVILKNNTDEALKCDIVQMAHHVINDVSSLYAKTQASVVFVPQSPAGSALNSTRQTAMNAVKKYVDEGMLFYASMGTTGLEVQNGEFVQVYSQKTWGGMYDGWSW